MLRLYIMVVEIKRRIFRIISETYNYIFIIKTDSDEVKSFSYRDVLTNTIELFW